jgi:hypothetical protein
MEKKLCYFHRTLHERGYSAWLKEKKVQPSGYSCDKSSMGKGSDCDYNKHLILESKFEMSRWSIMRL